MRATDLKIPWYGYAGMAGLLVLVLLYYGINPERGGFPACPFHELTGFFCTGCGSQRALHDLLHLDVAGALGHNLLFPPVVVLLAWHVVSRMAARSGRRAWKSPLDYSRAPLLVLGIVLVFTLLRNLPWEPFRLLAP
ncbi:DUF2752 domain-containing protein [Robiginitalea sp. SC105]|uniref:DUF2752 domain-containing protein n=1 Tax=Robiginitalea sp. SC105 TaxID=2762332 RepID=UPI00163A6D75|nr:DUF2752 domain-containing protein [Robiginitalea sp. SC105]MBC2840010.1 DUF2752 domain-containing protein [Robiginitalea sp. SC105]